MARKKYQLDKATKRRLLTRLPKKHHHISPKALLNAMHDENVYQPTTCIIPFLRWLIADDENAGAQAASFVALQIAEGLVSEWREYRESAHDLQTALSRFAELKPLQYFCPICGDEAASIEAHAPCPKR